MSQAEAEQRERTRQRWLQSAPAPLVLVNPPERSRRYCDGGVFGPVYAGGEESLSVLGSKGEWKVVSTDKSRWVAMDLGSVRLVHAIVLQCGALGRSFSGWVTRLKVHHATQALPPSDADEWTALGRDLVTTCTSDPACEHRIELREPQWMRHVRLTPSA